MITVAKQVRTETVWVCDRCGHESKDFGDTRGRQSRYTKLAGLTQEGQQMLDMSWGGSTVKHEIWFCMDCSADFERFLNERSKEKCNNQDT